MYQHTKRDVITPVFVYHFGRSTLRSLVFAWELFTNYLLQPLQAILASCSKADPREPVVRAYGHPRRTER